MVSQREARIIKKRCAELEDILDGQRKHWVSDWPRGAVIASLTNIPPSELSAVKTARKLKHAVVCTVRDDGAIMFIACPLASAYAK